MSGICGVVGKPADNLAEVLGSMLKRIRHRGPDGTIDYVDEATGTAIGYSHLALNSVTANSEWAFSDSANICVAIDGCATGLTENDVLNGATPTDGHGNQTVRRLIAAYKRYGHDFLSQLDGPFSAVLLDKNTNQLFLSRDKLGEKSLYYYLAPGDQHLIFGSEIKAILSHPDVQPTLDRESLSLHLAFGYVPGPKTLFKNIYKLLPGESFQVRNGAEPEKKRYWTLPAITDTVLDKATCQKTLKELFMQGLERYVDGCDVIGVFLSGGIDSSILVAALRSLGVDQISTFTIGFTLDPSRPQTDDLFYARQVAQKFGTDHHEIVVAPGHQPGPRLAHVIRQFDNLVMTPNSYSKCLLAEAVAEAGVRLVVTGSAAAGACGIHRQFLNHKKRAKWLQKTETCANDEEKYYTLRGRLFPLEQQTQLLRQPLVADKRDVVAALHHYVANVKGPDFFRRFLFANLMITSTEKSVRVLDNVGSMASVEMRAPYLDRSLVEFSTKLPNSFDGGETLVSLKTLLQDAFAADLPKSVLQRKVIGYPSYYWQNGELAEYQEKLLAPAAIAENGIFDQAAVSNILRDERHSEAKSVGKHSWALLQFSLWYEIFIKQNGSFGRG